MTVTREQSRTEAVQALFDGLQQFSRQLASLERLGLVARSDLAGLLSDNPIPPDTEDLPDATTEDSKDARV